MYSGVDFPFASALEGDFSLALEVDFGFHFAFRVGLGTVLEYTGGNTGFFEIGKHFWT